MGEETQRNSLFKGFLILWTNHQLDEKSNGSKQVQQYIEESLTSFYRYSIVF